METIREEVKEHMKGQSPSHDWTHVERVLKNALHIAKIEGADLEIVELAALLHDIARDKDATTTGTGTACHAVEGAKMAEEILKKHSYPDKKIKAVCHCIETHRFRDPTLPPKTLEAKVLFDSDKLDAMGAVGIARAYCVGGEYNQKLYSDFHAEPELTKFSDHSTHTPVVEFQMKLSKLKDAMFTEEGKRIALERHDFMTEFYKRLEQEVKGEL